MGTRLGIVGSRHFPAREVVQSFIAFLPSDTIIVSGGAEGVDGWAVEAGKSVGLATIVFHADWEKLGHKAGPIRNAEIVRSADKVVAFWDGRSRGTLNTIVLAVSAGVPLNVFDAEGSALPLEWVLQQARERGVIAAIENAKVATNSK